MKKLVIAMFSVVILVGCKIGERPKDVEQNNRQTVNKVDYARNIARFDRFVDKEYNIVCYGYIDDHRFGANATSSISCVELGERQKYDRGY